MSLRTIRTRSKDEDYIIGQLYVCLVQKRDAIHHLISKVAFLRLKRDEVLLRRVCWSIPCSQPDLAPYRLPVTVQGFSLCRNLLVPGWLAESNAKETGT